MIAYLRPPPTSVSLFVRRTPIRLAGALQAIYPNAPHKRRRPPSQPPRSKVGFQSRLRCPLLAFVVRNDCEEGWRWTG